MKDSALNTDHAKALLDRARRYCALSEQCESGVRQKLITWGAVSSEVDAIVASLRADSYLDDFRYARSYCESKMLGQQWGRQKVVYQLRMKHLHKDAIDAALAAVDEGCYLDALRSAADTKLREMGLGPDPQLSFDEHRRPFSFLLSRGYTSTEINQVITNIDEQ